MVGIDYGRQLYPGNQYTRLPPPKCATNVRLLNLSAIIPATTIGYRRLPCWELAPARHYEKYDCCCCLLLKFPPPKPHQVDLKKSITWCVVSTQITICDCFLCTTGTFLKYHAHVLYFALLQLGMNRNAQVMHLAPCEIWRSWLPAESIMAGGLWSHITVDLFAWLLPRGFLQQQRQRGFCRLFCRGNHFSWCRWWLIAEH